MCYRFESKGGHDALEPLQYNPDKEVVDHVQEIIRKYLEIENEELYDGTGHNQQDTHSMANNFSVAGASNAGQGRSKNESAQQALFNI